jgi:hypothetical protein
MGLLDDGSLGWKGYASQCLPGIITRSEGLKHFELIFLGFETKT